MAKKSDIKCKIHKTHAVLSESKNTKKIFASISWNDGEERNEIRNVFTDADGKSIVTKGISMTDDEMDALVDAYQAYRKLKDNKPKPVDLNAIYQSSTDIIEKRSHGELTQDGFTVLKRTKNH